jgi:hypothetical protein
MAQMTGVLLEKVVVEASVSTGGLDGVMRICAEADVPPNDIANSKSAVRIMSSISSLSTRSSHQFRISFRPQLLAEQLVSGQVKNWRW